MTTSYKQYREQVKRYSDGAIRDLIEGKKRSMENAEIELGALQEEQAARERARSEFSPEKLIEATEDLERAKEELVRTYTQTVSTLDRARRRLREISGQL